MRGYGYSSWSSCWKVYREAKRDRDYGTLDVLPIGGPVRRALKKRARRHLKKELQEQL